MVVKKKNRKKTVSSFKDLSLLHTYNNGIKEDKEIVIKFEDFRSIEDLERLVLDRFLECWCGEFEVPIGSCGGIVEVYYSLKERGLPAFEWVSDAYQYVKRKKDNGSIDIEGNINGYYITVLRNWMLNGRGNSGTWQDRFIVDAFREVFGDLKVDQVKEVYVLIGNYGALAVYIAINDYEIASNNFDDYVKKEIKETIPVATGQQKKK